MKATIYQKESVSVGKKVPLKNITNGINSKYLGFKP